MRLATGDELVLSTIPDLPTFQRAGERQSRITGDEILGDRALYFSLYRT